MAKGPKGPKGPMKGPAKMGKGPGPGAGKKRPLPLPKPKGYGQVQPNGVKPNPVPVNGTENGAPQPGLVPAINTPNPNPAIVTNGPRVSPRGSVSPREQSPRENGAPHTVPQVNVQDPSGGSRPISIAATNALQVVAPSINGTNVSPGTTPPTESAEDFRKRDASRLTQMLSGESTYMQAWPTSPTPPRDPADVVITRRPSQIDRPDSFYLVSSISRVLGEVILIFVLGFSWQRGAVPEH